MIDSSRSGFRLRDLAFSLRVSITALVLVIAGGYAASLAHLWDHYAGKDERPGLSAADLEASFHGAKQTSALLESLRGAHGRDYSDAKEREVLIDWLSGSRISEDYDSIDLGDSAPAEILARRCVGCHARNAANSAAGDAFERLPLEYWDDVAKVAFSREFHPVPLKILTTTTHTHALTIPLVAIAGALLLIFSGWPRVLVNAITLIGSVGLLIDIACWWLARVQALAVHGILIGGALFSAALGLQIVLGLADLWFGRRTR